MRDECLCGHHHAAHQHHRSGSDCAFCEPGRCRRYRSGGTLNRLIEKLTGLSRQDPSRSDAADPTGATRRTGRSVA